MSLAMLLMIPIVSMALGQSVSSISLQSSASLDNKPLRVYGVKAEPFFWFDKKGRPLGLALAILDIIMPMLNRTYVLIPQPENVYGVPQKNGSYNGLIKNLIDKEADLALYLSFTPARFAVIDYTAPWLSDQVRILVNADYSAKNLRYLVRKDNADEVFLKTSPVPKIKQIWENILMYNGFVRNISEGIDKVMKGGYGFVATLSGTASYESKMSVLEYTNDILQTKWGGFATPKGSPLTDQISMHLSTIMEKGHVQSIFAKYKLNQAGC